MIAIYQNQTWKQEERPYSSDSLQHPHKSPVFPLVFVFWQLKAKQATMVTSLLLSFSFKTTDLICVMKSKEHEHSNWYLSNQNTPYFTAYFRFLNTTELFEIFSFSFLGLAMFFVSFWRFSLSWLSFTWTKQRIFLFAISEDCNRRKMHFLFLWNILTLVFFSQLSEHRFP